MRLSIAEEHPGDLLLTETEFSEYYDSGLRKLETPMVGTAAYSCKTWAVRVGMRLSMAEEPPGDLLLTVTESFSEYYDSGLRKLEIPMVPCAFSGISLHCCLSLRELGL